MSEIQADVPTATVVPATPAATDTPQPLPEPTPTEALMVSEHYVMVGAVDRNQQVVLPPCKVTLVELEGWAQKYLHLLSTSEKCTKITEVKVYHFMLNTN